MTITIIIILVFIKFIFLFHIFYLVLKEHNLFKNCQHDCQFYSPIFDIFTTSQKKLGLDLYFQLCHYMNWNFFAAYFIVEKAIPDFVELVCSKVLQPTLWTCLLLERCQFFFEKSASKFTNENELLERPASPFDSLKIIMKQKLYENNIQFTIQNITNEIYYQIEYIIEQLFIAENEQNLFSIIEKNKQFYIEMANKATNLIDQSNELPNNNNASMNNLKDVLILFNSLLSYFNRSYDCDFVISFESNDLNSDNKFCFLAKMFCINKHKQNLILNQKNSKYALHQTKLLYTLMVDAFEYFYDCPLFDSLAFILEEYRIVGFNHVSHLLKNDPLWSNLLEYYEQFDDSNYFEIFHIVTKMIKHSKSDNDILHRLQLLLTFIIIILMQNRIQNIEYFDKLFQKRVNLHQTNMLPYDSNQFGRNLIKEVLFSKLKVDFKNIKTRKLAMEIIFCMYIIILLKPNNCDFFFPMTSN